MLSNKRFGMKHIKAGEFKARCLSIIEQIAKSHEPVIITRYGKPLVRIEPVNTDKDADDKPLKGMATYIGDIVSPVDEDWEAAR